VVDSPKTEKDVIEELMALRSRMAELEQVESEHKRTEEALKESEERFRNLMEYIPGVSVQGYDTEGTVFYWNKASEKVYGYTAEEAIGKNLGDLIIPPDVKPHFEKALEVGKTIKTSGELLPAGEVMLLHKDGYLVPVYSIHTAVNIEGKKPLLFCIDVDLSHRMKVEDALRESEERFRALIESTSDWVWEVDINSVYTYSSPKVRDLMGYEPEEVLGKTPFDLMPPDEAERVAALFKDIIASRKPFSALENTNFRKDGGLVVLETSGEPIFDESGELLGYRGIDRNITERKQTEEALQKARDELENRVERRTAELAEANRILMNEISERRQAEDALRIAGDDWENIFKSIGDVVLILDNEHRIMDANRAAVAILREPKEKIIGRFCYELFHDTSHPPENCPSKKLLSSEHPETVDMEMQVLNGIYMVTVAPIFDSEGKVVKTIHIAKDITERKKAEEKLLVYQKELRSLASELSLAEERLRRRMATNVHDHIGQTLAISKIKIESLAESVSSPEYANALEDVGNLIAQAIESTRSLTFELSPPVLYELGFEAAMEWLVRQTRQQHNLSAEFKDDGQAKPLDSDVRVLLFQAVRELLVNVAKHAQARNVEVSTQRVGGEIQVVVEDDGVGFDISQSRSQDYRTAGFGLFSIRERLDHIGGHIDISSKPDHGSRITLVAPIGQKNENKKEVRK